MGYNILQFSNFSAPYAGNFMCSIFNLSTMLKENNVDTVYLFPNSCKEREWSWNLSKKEKVYFQTGNVFSDLRLLDQIITENNIDIIHSHFMSPTDEFRLNLLQGIRPSVRKITHFHNHYFTSKNWLKGKCKAWLYNSDAYIGCSISVANSIKNGLDTSNVYGISNAIDFSRLNIINKINLASLKIKENTNIILMFGFDYFRKGVDIAITAIKDIAEEYNIVLAISLAVRKEQAIKNIKKQFGEIPHWIILLDPRDDIASYYSMARIFISPSREEGFCYSLVEAAYCHCSTIASLIPGQDELKIPHTSYFKKESSVDLRRVILEELSWSNEKRTNYSNEDKNYVMKNFNLENWCQKIVNVYDSTLQQKTREALFRHKYS